MNHNIKDFSSFVNEAYASEEEKREAVQGLAHFRELLDAGLITKAQYEKHRRAIVKQGGGPMASLTDPILAEVTHPDLFRAMQTPTYQALLAKGFRLKSTDIQLFRGTLALGGSTNAATAIGVFASGYIRRFWGTNEPKVIVSSLPGRGPEMYENGFKWILANIDPATDGLFMYPKSKRTDPGVHIPLYGGSPRTE